MPQTLRQTIRWFLQRLDTHPLTTTAATVGGFTIAGLVSWNVLEWLQSPTTTPDKQQPMSMEEARLRAMIENAQTSTWQENLDHAATAQEHFMLPGRPHSKPNFMAEIDKRSLEILKAQHDELEKESSNTKHQHLRKDTATRIWNN